MILQPSDFQVDRTIGQIEQPYVEQAVIDFIGKYEKRFFATMIGDDLYSELNAGIEEDPINEKWLILIDKLKMAAVDYVYFYYMKNDYSTTSGIGENVPLSENAVHTTHREKMIAAWNEMVELNRDFVKWMGGNIATYPEYEGADCNLLFDYINTFGI